MGCKLISFQTVTYFHKNIKMKIIFVETAQK